MKHESRMQEYQTVFEEYLNSLYGDFSEEPQKILFEAIRYSLLSGGKRLRPILTLEFCRMCGGDWVKAVPFAAAIEMIHTYSLIHDDLPCMDNDDYRRGKPTSHKVYGEAMAILAGDALLTDAFAIAAEVQLPDPGMLGLAIGVLSNCAGSMGMVGGQVLDILSEERECSEQEVLDIQIRKTGALINAACVLGVIAAGGSEEQIAAAGGFAGALGLAFQIRDDILDVIGSKEDLGKAVGKDQQKNTFVRLYGMEKAEESVNKYTQVALKYLDSFEDTQFMKWLAESLTSRNH